MPTVDGVVTAPLSELLGRLRGGDLSPVELVDSALAQIERHNPRINAYVLVLADEARRQARESEERIRRGEARALEGVPVAIKDNVHLRGTPTTLASNATGHRVSDVDSAVVARLRDAGCVLLGKTNLPELGTLPSTENTRFGATRNPWETERIAGGSSGGAAAAVASGMAAAAHGNDAGGSLRIPSACCGLFAVKPTRGRISTAPAGETPFSLNVEGFITRTVRDNALLLDATHGPVPGDMVIAPPPSRPYADEVGAPPGRLRVAIVASPPLGFPVDDVYLRALQDTAAMCTDMGHDVEEFSPPWNDNELFELFNVIWATYFGRIVAQLVDEGGDVEKLEPFNRFLWETSREITAPQYMRACDGMLRITRGIVAAEQPYDVVLTPALAKPPLRIGELWDGADTDVTAPMLNAAMFTPFTVPANLSGQPAALLPLFEADGLPVAVQAMARHGDEATLFRFASQLEGARPWAQRRPPLD
jgi:amidase